MKLSASSFEDANRSASTFPGLQRLMGTSEHVAQRILVHVF